MEMNYNLKNLATSFKFFSWVLKALFKNDNGLVGNHFHGTQINK